MKISLAARRRQHVHVLYKNDVANQLNFLAWSPRIRALNILKCERMITYEIRCSEKERQRRRMLSGKIKQWRTKLSLG